MNPWLLPLESGGDGGYTPPSVNDFIFDTPVIPGTPTWMNKPFWQAVEVVACELEPVQGLGLVLVSYAVRVVGVGAGIWFVTSHPQLGPATDRNWLAAAVIATVLAWTTGVVVVASRQRVPIYDIHDQG